MLSEIVKKFKGKRIAVVGDYCVDHIVRGMMVKISREAPVPVIEKISEIKTPGGSGNTAANVYSMGALVYPLTFIGEDSYSNFIVKYFKNKGNIEGLILDPERETHCYLKVYGEVLHGADQQVIRIDTNKQSEIDSDKCNKLIKILEKNIKNIDAIIVADYKKGNVSEELASEIANLSNKHKKICIGESRERIKIFKNFTCIKPNDYEAVSSVYNIPIERFDPEDEKIIIKAGLSLLKKLSLNYIIISRGEYGMITLKGNNKTDVEIIPTKKVEVSDITGAGDTTCAAITLALASGATIKEAARIGNAAGGIAVSKRGTVTVSFEDLLKVVDRY